MDSVDVRSPQGHAAYSMQGLDDRWILIQQNTFKNWVNDQLQQMDLKVENLQTDLCDGIKLCALMELLQGRKVGRVVKKPINQHQFLDNANLALRAMARDGIKLVNIGAEDIVNSNIRLIMGLVWRLILKYQISQSKVPPKKLMLSWINAVMPNRGISNFSSDWNDGIALHGLIEYCKPGTCPDWKQLSRRDGLQNCQQAMQLAKSHYFLQYTNLQNCQQAMQLAKSLFDIPMILSPENLASPDLDELSGMTYMSYFMKLDSPGYHATLKFVQGRIPQQNVTNFQTDWNSGLTLSHLVMSFNGAIPGWPNVNRNDWVKLNQMAMDGGQSLGVDPVISAKEISDPEVDHLGVMAHAAWFEHLKPKEVRPATPPPPVEVRSPTPPTPPVIKNPAEQLALKSPDRDTVMGNAVQFTLESLDSDVDPEHVRIEVQGPSSNPAYSIKWEGQYGYGEFVPTEPGPHRIVVYNEGAVVHGAPCDLEVGIDASSITLATHINSCPVGVELPLRLNAADVRRGAVKVEARSPTGRISQDLSVIETNGVYTANFTPTEVGDWNISILYEGQHIQGSPFSVRVYDAAQVKVFGLEGGSVGRMFSFSVDTAGAGEGELTVDIMHNGTTVPVHVYPEGRGMYRITFTPDGAGIYTIKVFFAGMEVTGSPYTLEIVDSSMVTASGEGLSHIEVNRRSLFVVNTGQKGSTGDIRVTVTSPKGTQIPCDVLNNGDGTYNVEYTANDVGEYVIDVYYYGKPIQGSPFKVHAFDWNRIAIRNLQQTCMVGKLCEFDIDAQNAGSGNLEIMINDGLIPCSVQNRGNRQFHATFMPKEAIPHFVQIRFNDREVNGSPWRVDIKNAAHVTAAGHGLELVPIHRPAMFEVRTGLTSDYGNVQANIVSPSERTVSTRVMNNQNGTYTIEYTPTEVGNYTIHMAYDSLPIPDSPFQSKAYDAGAIVVSQIPNGIVGKPVEFTIDVTQAGEGQLEIMVNRGAVPNTVKMLRKGVFLVAFVPMDTQSHVVDIKFNGELLPRCPLNVPILDASRVTVQGDGLHQVAVNRQSQFRVTTQTGADADLRVRVTAPSGKQFPARIRGNSTKGFDVNFKPEEVGQHRVEVEFAEQPVPGSPFWLKVYDQNRVIVEGVKNGIVGKLASFVVDVNEAGEGNLEIAVVSGGRNIQNHVRQLAAGKFEVGYTPAEGGQHSAEVTFNGEHVKGSPFPFCVVDPSKISATGDGLGLVPCNKPTTFTIHTPREAEDLEELKVAVTGPSGREVLPRLHHDGHGNITVDWTPRETGEYRVDIRYHDQPVRGSPFVVKTWDAQMVVVSDITTGRVGHTGDFYIDASRAGSGSLEINVTALEENVPNFVQSEGGARFHVSFTPQLQETHMISVRFNGEQVPGSPFVCDMKGSAPILPLDHPGLIRVALGEPAVVSIDPRRMGHLVEDVRVHVIAPSDRVTRARVHLIPGHNRFKAEFVPREVGPHCIQANIGDYEITGSPFACEVYDLSKVKVSKLGKGILGKPYDFEVDTSRAGQGELDVFVKCGNKKVPFKLVEKSPGIYKVYFLPREPLRHLVAVTYTREHVAGSPFLVDVEDSTLVVARGRSLEASSINKKASFEIDPSNAPFKANAHVKITGPSPDKQSVPCRMSGNYLDGWKVDWVPKQLGVHLVEIRYGENHVVGSPFKCKVYDLSKVLIIRDQSMQGVDVDGIPGEDIVFYVDASDAGAGNLEIIVRCAKDGTRIPNYLEAEDHSGKFRIYFTPKADCYRYKVDVAFNDEHITGSPFFCHLVDGEKVTASGEGLKLTPANHPAYFHIQTNGIGEAGLEVSIISPSGRDLPVRVTGSSVAGYHVEYLPTEVGRHRVSIEYADAEIQDSPFFPDVYDSSLVKVNAPQQCILGNPVLLKVDHTQAGRGLTQTDVQGPHSRPHTHITEPSPDTQHVRFEPTESGLYTISVTFNKEEVPHSPLKCHVYDLSKLDFNLDELDTVPAGKPVVLRLDTRGAPIGELDVAVVDAYNQDVPMSVEKLGEAVFVIEFTPQEVGTHTLTVTAEGVHLAGSPHGFSVYDASKVRLQEMTRTGILGEEVAFVVDSSEAGPGKLQVGVSCQGLSVPVKHRQRDTFTHQFVFQPAQDADHRIQVDFNGEAVTGSPVSMSVMDPLKRMSISRNSQRLSAVNRDAWSLIETQGARIDQDLVVVNIIAPNGDQVPAKIVQQPDGDFKVEYSSKYTGRHTVEILYAGQAIMGSPFYVEIYDPNKIRVEGERKGTVGQRMEFDVIRNEAGKAELGLSITSASGRNVPYDIVPTPLGDRVTYVPTEAGPHNIYITYGGLEVPGCPITQNIIDTATGIVVSGDGLYKAIQNRAAEFRVNAKGHRGDLFVQVEGPNSIARCHVEPDGLGAYIVRYTPVEAGRFNVTLRWNGTELSGSPYHPEVINPTGVHIIGGWASVLDANNQMALQVNTTKRVEFDTSQAGPGQLTCEVQGPNGRIPTFIDQQGGRWILTFTPTAEGEHFVSIYWSGAHIQNSPFHGFAQSVRQVNSEKVVLSGRGLKEAKVKEEAEFVIDGSQAGQGEPSVQLTGIKADIDVRCLPIGDNKYRCSYVPKLAGAYLLNIMWSGRHVKGGPYKVNVMATSDASKVLATGEGLKTGIMGRDIKATIDVRRAGPGELTAHCMGPTKASICELFDHHDGTFTLSVKPSEPGRHVLQIMFGGEHVPGSPFELKIAGAPDASKVRVSGPGIEHGILATFESRFLCETKGAGAGQLTVRIRGPKGAFRVEMQRESQKDRTILCHYEPREVGDYVLSVKWSNEHVPGSPFRVQIFDTQQELERFLRDHPERRTNATTSRSITTNGWHDDF